jgi:hypothetical protein
MDHGDGKIYLYIISAYGFSDLTLTQAENDP